MLRRFESYSLHQSPVTERHTYQFQKLGSVGSNPTGATMAMDGYKREQNMTNQLVAMTRIALNRRPNERLGQLILNATRGEDLFELHDEELLDKLNSYVGDL